MLIKEVRVANRLHEARVTVGLTQEILAKELGVTRQTICAIEKNNYVPSIQLALKIGKYFKIPIEKLFWILD